MQGDCVGGRPSPKTAPLNEDGTTGVEKSTSVEPHQSGRGWLESCGRSEKKHACKKRGQALMAIKLVMSLERGTAGVSSGQHYTGDTVVHHAYTDLPLWTILMLT